MTTERTTIREPKRKFPPRAELDRAAWATIHARPPFSGSPDGLVLSGRPANYRELGELIERGIDFEHAWSEFLHEFYRYKSAGFFAERPPAVLSPGWKAVLAGSAEFLSTNFGLPVPNWTASAEYVLPELWDPWEDICPDLEEFRELRVAKAHPVYLKRNVVFETRNLIAL